MKLLLWIQYAFKYMHTTLISIASKLIWGTVTNVCYWLTYGFVYWAITLRPLKCKNQKPHHLHHVIIEVQPKARNDWAIWRGRTQRVNTSTQVASTNICSAATHNLPPTKHNSLLAIKSKVIYGYIYYIIYHCILANSWQYCKCFFLFPTLW